MRYARTTFQAIGAALVGTLLFVALLGVMGCAALIVMIERVEMAVAGDECAGMAIQQQDFAPGLVKDERGRK